MKDISNPKIWLISDTHAGHHNIIEYCNRPFKNVEIMTQSLAYQWNKYIKEDDIVFHLGDVGFSRQATEEFISQVKGKKYLIMGNHDHEAIGSYYKMGFLGVYSSLEFRYKGIDFHLSHRPRAFGKLKFKLFLRRFLDIMKIKWFSGWLRKVKNPLLPENIWNLHGHTHKNTPQLDIKNKMVNCCVDCWDYKPVSLDSIISMIQKEQNKCQK